MGNTLQNHGDMNAEVNNVSMEQQEEDIRCPVRQEDAVDSEGKLNYMVLLSAMSCGLETCR